MRKPIITNYQTFFPSVYLPRPGPLMGDFFFFENTVHLISAIVIHSLKSVIYLLQAKFQFPS